MNIPVCFIKQKTAYEMRISDWSSDVCSSDLMAAQEVEAFLEGYQRQVNQSRAHDTAERALAERELGALARKLDGLYDAIADELRSPGLSEKLQSLEAQRAALRLTLDKPAPSPTRSDEQTSEFQSLMRTP